MIVRPTSDREYTRIVNKQRNLPAQLERARRRVKQLENDCIVYGMRGLLENPEHINSAWDREVDLAWQANTEGLE